MINVISGDITTINKGFVGLPVASDKSSRGNPISDIPGALSPWFSSYITLCEQNPFGACVSVPIKDKLFISNLFCLQNNKPFSRKISLPVFRQTLQLLHDEAFH